MRFSSLSNPFLLPSILSLPKVFALDTNTVSITAVPEFAIEPACVQSCVFYNSFEVADYLVFGLGCTSTIYNACYCTQIMDQSASTLLSGCVNTLCRGTTEISNAISLYESYCAGAGYPRSVSATSTTVSSSSSSTPAGLTPSSLLLLTPDSSSASTSSSGSTSTSSSSSSSSTPSPSTSSKSSSASSTSSSSTPTSSTTPSIPQPSKSSSSSLSKADPIVEVLIGSLAGLWLLFYMIYNI